MVVVALFIVLIVSIVVAYVGLRYANGATSVRRAPAVTVTSDPPIDLTKGSSRSGSFSPPDWDARGFDLDAAMAWFDHGFDPDHAFLFRSLELDPSTAARLRGAGLEDSALVALVEEASFAHHNGHEQLVMLAEQAPHLAPQALAWLRLGASTDQALAYAREGFTPAASDTWRAVGWHLDEALPWFTARFEPTPALAWRDTGFTAAEAEAWRREHFGVRHAIEWRHLGAHETRRWLHAGVRTAANADALRARGYGPDDMSYAAALTRDDLLSAASQIESAGGSVDVARRMREAAAGAGRVRDVGMELIEDVLAELDRLVDAGRIPAPTAAKASARRFERGLLEAAQTPAT